MTSGKLQILHDSTISAEKENVANINVANKAESGAVRGGRSTSEEAEGEKKDSQPDKIILLESNNEAVNFTARELLEKAKRGAKATSAQQTFRYVLKQAASRYGLWDNPPLMAKIGGKVMECFLNQATKEVQIYCHQKAPQDKLPQKEQLITTTDVVETQLKSQGMDDDEDDGFQFTAGEELFVMSGAERLSQVTFVRQSAKNDEYAILVMQTNYDDKQSENRKLAGPNKLEFLHEVKVAGKGKENAKKGKNKKACQVLRMASGRQKNPLEDRTGLLNRPPVELDPKPLPSVPVEAVEPVVEVEPIVPIPDQSFEDDLSLPLTSSARNRSFDDDLSLPPTSPARSRSYLSDLFDMNSETLGEKIERVLQNQKFYFR
ncbi:hypothetical protein OS493_018498 [Desmophyllum pertusum]|uniref:Uncharacterized protein n=1 Tax=Desmophyllum pertusum TaxID=174260 RepID=A0A9X0D9G6_9CNID|nr:hypothetical protein OS493_018498 [Desmophyllum pertusum]